MQFNKIELHNEGKASEVTKLYVVCEALFKYQIQHFAKLLGGWYLFEIYHTLSTLKTNKNVVKSGSKSAMKSEFFFEMKEGCNVSFVKLVLWSIVAQKGTNILIFYIFEYGAECSTESGAK